MRCHRQLYLFHALTGSSSLVHSWPIVWDMGSGGHGKWEPWDGGMDGCQTQIELCDMRQLCLTSPDKCARLGSIADPRKHYRALKGALKQVVLPVQDLQSVKLVWLRVDWSIHHPVTHVSVGHHLPSRNTPPSDRGKGPPSDRTTPDCTSTSQLPVRPSLSYLNKELTARAANLPAPVNSNSFCANDSWKT
jgi:hypothetical protein